MSTQRKIIDYNEYGDVAIPYPVVNLLVFIAGIGVGFVLTVFTFGINPLNYF